MNNVAIICIICFFFIIICIFRFRVIIKEDYVQKYNDYHTLARRELIKRYQKKYENMSDEKLKKSYALLLVKNQEDRISRVEYEELNVARAEMNKRRFPT